MRNKNKIDIDFNRLIPADDEEFSLPLDLTDIIYICREYSKMGFNIQNQVDNILEEGIENSINKGIVKKENIPQIKQFLKAVSSNRLLGDAADQSDECLNLIKQFEYKHNVYFNLKVN